eukprot:7057133-Pyramimonas_sp.AAC.1
MEGDGHDLRTEAEQGPPPRRICTPRSVTFSVHVVAEASFIHSWRSVQALENVSLNPLMMYSARSDS